MGKNSIQTPEFRVSFWTGWEGKENDAGKVKYGCTMLFAKGEQLKAIKDMATVIMTEKFGEDKTKWPKDFYRPWRDQGERDKNNPNRGEDKKPYDGYEMGALYINCNSADTPPNVVDHNVNDILDRKQVYSGCYGKAQIDMYWFEAKNKQGGVLKKGISCSMTHFMKLRDGAPLGNTRALSADIFKPVAVDTSKGAAAVFEDDGDPMA